MPSNGPAPTGPKPSFVEPFRRVKGGITIGELFRSLFPLVPASRPHYNTPAPAPKGLVETAGVKPSGAEGEMYPTTQMTAHRITLDWMKSQERWARAIREGDMEPMGVLHTVNMQEPWITTSNGE
jgi:hypothetical protein